MNKIFISGNLTRDPEVRYTSGGKPYAKMGIAVQRGFKKPDGTQEVDFFNLTAWEKKAEFCGKYLRKGSKVLIEGRLQTSSYEGKDGIKKTGYDVIIENVEFVGSKPADSGEVQSVYKKEELQNNSAEELNSEFSGENVADEDVPF